MTGIDGLQETKRKEGLPRGTFWRNREIHMEALAIEAKFTEATTSWRQGVSGPLAICKGI